jgi:hypothetical protein
VYVAFDGPLDQFFMREPSRLFSRPIERAAIDPTNPQILEAHVMCAAHELPLDPRVMPAGGYASCSGGYASCSGNNGVGAGFGGVGGGNDARLYFGSALEDMCAGLVRKKKLGRDPRLGALTAGDVRLRWIGGGGGYSSSYFDRYYDHGGGGGGGGGDNSSSGGGLSYGGGGGFMPDAGTSAYSNTSAARRGPANEVSIRAIEDERYKLVDEASGRVIEEVEASKVGLYSC